VLRGAGPGGAGHISVKNLSAGYGGPDIIGGVEFEAAAGDFLCIAGPNGSGKSTLLRALARLIPCRGEVRVDGVDIAALKRRDLAKKIAILGQTAQFYFPHTVYDTVAMGRYAYGQGLIPALRGPDRKIIEEKLEQLELGGLREERITELSGGQLQRVFLARTLVQDPAVILLDEPTNHLDLKYQVELFRRLGEWASGGGGIVIAALHDLNLARAFTRRMILLDRGRVKAAGPTAGVLDSAAPAVAYGMDIGAFMRNSLGRWNSKDGEDNGIIV
jgi:iron complex transport system ATP-binding protein